MASDDINFALSNSIASASFLLTAIALLLTAIAIAIGAWANWKAKQAEVEGARLELSYRLMLAASGGGDARLPNGDTHYSAMEVQTTAIAALRSFPENLTVYERLLVERRRQLSITPDDVFRQTLERETRELVTSLKTTTRRRKR